MITISCEVREDGCALRQMLKMYFEIFEDPAHDADGDFVTT